MNEPNPDPKNVSPDRSPPPPPPDVALCPVIPSEQLLRGGNEVLIDHQGNLYRLRLTRSGKLILHK